MQDEIKKVDRCAVRALAEKHSQELQQISNAGGNHYQTALDQQDNIVEFTSSMTEEDATAFINMYAEELDACTQTTIDKTNKILVETEANNHTVEAIGGVIGFIILLFIIFSILK
jgi:hypothetical protein